MSNTKTDTEKKIFNFKSKKKMRDKTSHYY